MVQSLPLTERRTRLTTWSLPRCVTTCRRRAAISNRQKAASPPFLPGVGLLLVADSCTRPLVFQLQFVHDFPSPSPVVKRENFMGGWNNADPLAGGRTKV